MEHVKSCSSNPFHLLLFFSFSAFSFLWLQALASSNETDHLSLLKFKQGITSDPHEIFNSWNDSLPFCSWLGITCSRRHERVTSFILQGQNLSGLISPFIGNLSFLRVLDLSDNSFQGQIPQELGKLFRLEYLFASSNSLTGEIPSNLSRCNQLKQISLNFNQLGGRIPSELGSLTELELLYLAANNLGGEIPASLGNLSSLTGFTFARNNLTGKIPADMDRLKSLTLFMVSANHLSGNVPARLFNISSIVFFSTAGNQLNGSIPENIGLTLPNLEEFYMGGNEFSGTIPNSLSNASHLQQFDVTINKFKGQVPYFGNQPNLSWLGLAENFLGFNISDDLMPLQSLTNSTKLQFLGLANNNFGGDLPDFVANLSTNLNRLHLGGNQFTGMIPEALENFVNLIDIRMEKNLFVGAILTYFGKLGKLQRLLLWGNRLSGEIPSSLGNLTQLYVLSLSENRLKGSIPASIGNCTGLNSLVVDQNELEGRIPYQIMLLPALTMFLNFADNLLSGNLPAEVGKLVNVNYLDVSKNKLSGEIPTTIGDCSALEYLYLQGNSFQGDIPSSLASLRSVRILDLSRNNLTGEIPKDLENLSFLQYLNLSFNDLQGEVPTEQVFRNATALSLTGNSKLCGGVTELLLPKCPEKLIKKGVSFSRTLKIAIIVTSVVLGCSFVLACVLVYRRKKPISSSVSTPLSTDLYVKVSYQDLYIATNGFSSENLIGAGSFGSVYKGFLDEIDKTVAIKVLKLEQKNAFKTLIAECNVLKNVKHRNLVKLLSYCSSLDYRQNEFKALIFEFMENGSLDEWLHHDNDNDNQARNLSFLERLNIAIDVASALHYLHDLYGRSIIHCDLKPSNVLLDKNMVARVSDFGLAKFLSINNDESRSESSTIGIKGTIGYAPPEYGMGSRASREGDVYSYGILILEIFSRKRPTDETMLKDNFTLHNLVKNALPEKVTEIVDPILITPREIENKKEKVEDDDDVANWLVSVFQVGIACSRESPKHRMKMVDVVKQLHLIRTSLMDSGFTDRGVCDSIS
ncbi:putative receptor-like protein kinase At3g47110 [Euphorbia lathyris]|uniref:putative receptor-like protein kinase At3g47110 n=1 Tax=Euphorbia lathyris TaxID=212925 RepID=UPI00331342D3